MTADVRVVSALFFAAVASSACAVPEWLELEEYPAPNPENDAWWRVLSRSERTRRLIERARRDLGRDVGDECKEWLRTVVIDASDGAANLPATCRHEEGEWERYRYGWYWCPNAFVSSLRTRIRQVEPGQIVQMIRKHDAYWYPHTAMVLARERDGIRWIDSNFVASETVGSHFESFEAFEANVCESDACYYAIYQVGD